MREGCSAASSSRRDGEMKIAAAMGFEGEDADQLPVSIEQAAAAAPGSNSAEVWITLPPSQAQVNRPLIWPLLTVNLPPE